ncbi:MAG: hypothetical protein ACHQ2Z_00050 [Elusimicrobiota bacterium]
MTLRQRNTARSLGLILVLGALASNPANAAGPNPNLNVAAIQYSEGQLPSQYQPYLAQTLGTRFQWVGSGNKADLSPYAVWHSDYMDSGGLDVPQVYGFAHDVAAQNGWNYESMFLHFNLDYTVPGGAVGPTGWSNMDCFDVWEQAGGVLSQGVGSCSSALNGALIFNGSAYSDVTRTLYAGTCGSTCRVNNGSDLYLGYAEPFALINLTVSTPRSGGSAAWQYWNGTGWATLSPGVDTSNGLAQDGAVQFSPPADWTPTIVNGSQSKYWVRSVVANSTTAPVLSRVWGDDWTSHSNSCNGGPCDARGWNAQACQSLATMNNGIQFCAQPSASATAQFRYQGRATGYWNHNYLFINPGDSQGGELTFVGALSARWAAQRGVPGDGIANPNALMLDNVGEHPQPSTPTWNANFTDAPCSPNCSSGQWQAYINALMPAVNSTLKSTYPALVAVGGNDSTTIYKSFFDFNLWELGSSSFVMGNIQYTFTNEFDSWLPANNPTGSKAIHAIWDNQHFNLNVTKSGQTTAHVWDGGNRTPMLSLASYYIAANQNTMLLYNTQGWSYFDTAEYYPWSDASSTLAAALSSDISTNTKTLSVTDASQFTTVGGPVYSTSYALRIGGQDALQCTKSGNTFTTTRPIVNSYPAGTKVEFAHVAYWADPNHPAPDASKVWYYANWFPAMWVDLGSPDASGWNGGARDIAYLTGTAASGQPACNPTNECAEVWRRDFANAVILDRVFHDTTLSSELELPGPAISLIDSARKLYGPYYRLNSDGTTGPPITSLTLVGAEAAILLKHPIGAGTLTGLPYTAVSSNSVTSNWSTTFSTGTIYYAILSTGSLPNNFTGNRSSNTLNAFAAFGGLASGTTYYGEVSTTAAGPFTSLGAVATLDSGSITAQPFTAISSYSVTANWRTTFPPGTLYRTALSSGAFPNNYAGNQSSNTLNDFASFAGLAPLTTYYARLSTAAAGQVYDLGSTLTLAVVVTTQTDVRLAWDPLDGNKALLAVESNDPAFPTTSPLSMRIVFPGDVLTLSLVRLSTGPLRYFTRVPAATFSTQDFYYSSGPFFTLVTIGAQDFTAYFHAQDIDPSLGGAAREASGPSQVIVMPGALSASAQISINPFASGDPRLQSLRDQHVPLLGSGREILFVSSGTLSQATLIVPFDPAAIPPNDQSSEVGLGHFVGGSWRYVSGISVDRVNNLITATVSSFSPFQPLLILPASTPGLAAAIVYPNPAVAPAEPTIRVCPGVVDSLDVTIFDVGGRVMNSSNQFTGPSTNLPGVGSGLSCYEYVWTGRKASGVYFAVIHAKASGTTVKARLKFSVVR